MKDKRILIVDDYSSVRTLLRIVLEDAGYRTIEAADGVGAVQAIEEHHPDLVVLDLMMPQVDGESVIRLLRDRSDTESLPIIVLTAKMDGLSPVIDLLGHKNVFGKPFDQDKLLERVGEVLGPGAQISTSAWQGEKRSN